MTASTVHGQFWPLYERASDYLFNMSALNRREARRQWREAIKEAWKNRCAYCGQPPIDDSSLTIDHVRPKCKGGEDKTSNVIPACASCNTAKGSQDWEEFLKNSEFYDIETEHRIRQWLSFGTGNFSYWDEKDAQKVNDQVKEWPSGSTMGNHPR